MKRSLLIAAIIGASLTFGAYADSDVQTVSVPTIYVRTSGVFTASGYLDRIEISQTAALTSAVVVASYDAAGTAIETYANVSAFTGNKVVRLRVIGTANTGTALTYAHQAGLDNQTNMVGQILVAPYERVLIGGNVKAVVTPGGTPTSSTNSVIIRLFYEPLQR